MQNIKMPIGTINLDVETYRNKVEKAFFQIYFPLKPKNSRFFGLATFAIWVTITIHIKGAP